jgi:hypothetical protein
MYQPRKVNQPIPSATNPKVMLDHTNPHEVLDMTVINRSNDMLLGALGANYVHFSFLQEYVALAAGFAVGRYNQISNNLHLYISPKEDGSRWLPTKCQPEELLAAAVNTNIHRNHPIVGRHIPLFTDREQFDKEINYIFEARLWRASSLESFGEAPFDFTSPFISKVAIPMILAFNHHKDRNYYDAINIDLKTVWAEDWFANCADWLKRRELSYNKAKDDGPHVQI